MTKLSPETPVTSLIQNMFKPAAPDPMTSAQMGYRDRVHETQVARLIEGSGFSNLVGFIMAVIWVGLLWNKLPHIVLGFWLGMMTFLFAVCAAIHHFKFYKIDSAHIPAEVLKRWYLLAVLFIGMGWGITSTLMFPYSQIEQIVLAFILVGVSASGVTYSQVAWVYFGYVGFVLMPLTVRLFYVGGDVYYALSAMTIFFLGVMIMAAYRMNKASTDALTLSYKNEELISNLTNARNDLEHLNSDLVERVEYAKKIESELKKARDEAERMSEAKGEFLANMSHEIRTPMNGVIGTLQLLEDTQLDESQHDYVNIALKSADALLNILNDILDLSKIEAGKLELEAVPFDLGEIVRDLVLLHSLIADQKGVNLRSEIDDNLPKIVVGDPTRMRQVLVNLISNALKFTSEGEVCVRVGVKLKDKNDVLVRVEVIDTGIGIPMDKHQRLFVAFTQADGSTTRKYGGTGLGLTIVRQLVELMRGNLSIESELGKGAKFSFVIPMGIAASKVLEQEPQVASYGTLLGRVLLVEDNPVNQMVAKKMLEKLGLEYILAANGKEALEKIDKEQIDVVLMDCQMPEMDGFEATRILREREMKANYSGLPVVAMTANVMEGDREKCLKAGMDDYLGKPVRLEELENVLRRWLLGSPQQ